MELAVSVFDLDDQQERHLNLALNKVSGCQQLDESILWFLDVAEKLQSRVIVAENVKGKLIGKAKGFVSLVL